MDISGKNFFFLSLHLLYCNKVNLVVPKDWLHYAEVAKLLPLRPHSYRQKNKLFRSVDIHCMGDYFFPRRISARRNMVSASLSIGGQARSGIVMPVWRHM